MPHCGYCRSTTHNIKECKQDNDLVFLLEKKNCPDFFKMSSRILKKIASLQDIKTSLPKVQLALKLTQLHKEIHESKEKTFDEDVCPICMEEFEGKKNTTITTCGHKFCTTCFIIYTRKNKTNTCPCCRHNIFQDNTGKQIYSLEEFPDNIRNNSPRNVIEVEGDIFTMEITNDLDSITENMVGLYNELDNIHYLSTNEIPDAPNVTLTRGTRGISFEDTEFQDMISNQITSPQDNLVEPIPDIPITPNFPTLYHPRSPSISPPRTPSTSPPPLERRLFSRSSSISPPPLERRLNVQYINENGEVSIDL